MIAIEPYDSDRRALLSLFRLADDSEARIADYLELGEVLVARDDGAVVGHVQILPATVDGLPEEIRSLAVLENRRGDGTGGALLDAAVSRCRAQGCRRVILATAAADLSNLGFYQRHGFRMLRIARDVFTPEAGYPSLVIDGIPLRDQVWFDRELGQ